MSVHLFIDASSLAYRAYHSLPPLAAPDGATETNAVHGLLNYLTRLVNDRHPARLTVALDADWRPRFRVDALPSYKTQRVAAAGDPEDLVMPQIAVAARILEAMGATVGAAEGYEAEDVIATLVARTTDPVEIVTGDRDLFALVRDGRVRVLYTLRGVTELAPVDETWIRAKYGIPGDRYLDFALLRGDPSDGLPGVAGIGEKTAAALVAKYGSLDAILSAADLTPAIRSKLAASAEYLSAARRVVPPATEAPVVAGDGSLPREPRDPAALEALVARYGVGGPVRRLQDALAHTIRA